MPRKLGACWYHIIDLSLSNNIKIQHTQVGYSKVSPISINQSCIISKFPIIYVVLYQYGCIFTDHSKKESVLDKDSTLYNSIVSS